LPSDQPWVRLDGLASADDLLVEYHHLTRRQIVRIPVADTENQKSRRIPLQ